MIKKNQRIYKIICCLCCLFCIALNSSTLHAKTKYVALYHEKNDSIAINKKLSNTPISITDSIKPNELFTKKFIPNSTKATWLAIIFPGGGQIYNKKYWKLPIIYGGFAGCAYALNWNNKMYNDYSQAYLDIMDKNPNTNSWKDLLPPNSRYDEQQLKDIIKRRKDTYRRYRDMSIFAFIGVYVISIIDAYVDAELSNFDLSPNLSVKLEPAVIKNQYNRNSSVGVQCAFRF